MLALNQARLFSSEYEYKYNGRKIAVRRSLTPNICLFFIGAGGGGSNQSDFYFSFFNPYHHFHSLPSSPPLLFRLLGCDFCCRCGCCRQTVYP